MKNLRETWLKQMVALLAVIMVVKVTVEVVMGYRDYFPPNFASDFLHGRQAYFSGAYSWAFYSHIVTGPLSLMAGLILISERFRVQFPAWHRLVGKTQILAVLFVLAPSGLWMAYYSEGGALATSGFSLLAIATGACAFMGWRSAVQKRFGVHRRWMLRCYLLLCSAVFIRLISGLATVTGIWGEWTDPFAAWASWLIPLAIYELRGPLKRTVARGNSFNTSILGLKPFDGVRDGHQRPQA